MEILKPYLQEIQQARERAGRRTCDSTQAARLLSSSHLLALQLHGLEHALSKKSGFSGWACDGHLKEYGPNLLRMAEHAQDKSLAKLLKTILEIDPLATAEEDPVCVCPTCDGDCEVGGEICPSCDGEGVTETSGNNGFVGYMETLAKFDQDYLAIPNRETSFQEMLTAQKAGDDESHQKASIQSRP